MITFLILHMISYTILYHWKHQYLTILSPIAVACQIEGIALCLGPSSVELKLPLNTAERLKLFFATLAGGQVILQDDIQLL